MLSSLHVISNQIHPGGMLQLIMLLRFHPERTEPSNNEIHSQTTDLSNFSALSWLV